MIVPFADLRAVDLQVATDALVSQERALPGQLPAAARPPWAWAVCSPPPTTTARAAAPSARSRPPRRSSGAAWPPGRSWGRAGASARRRDGWPPTGRLPRVAVAPASRPAASSACSRAERRPSSTAARRGSRRSRPSAASTRGAPLRFAADVDADGIRRAAQAGEVVITDTNRRQAFVAARLRSNRGPVLASAEELSEDGAMLDPFDRGPDAQTVSVLDGIARVHAPSSPQTTQFARAPAVRRGRRRPAHGVARPTGR